MERSRYLLLSSTSISSTSVNPSSKDAESMLHEEYYKRAQAKHQSEIANGLLLFGDSKSPQPTTTINSHKIVKYSDSQFYTLSAVIDKNQSNTFGTRPPLITVP